MEKSSFQSTTLQPADEEERGKALSPSERLIQAAARMTTCERLAVADSREVDSTLGSILPMKEDVGLGQHLDEKNEQRLTLTDAEPHR